MARGGGYGLDAELAAQRDAKYDRGLEAEVRQWIEEVTGELFPGKVRRQCEDRLLIRTAPSNVSNHVCLFFLPSFLSDP